MAVIAGSVVFTDSSARAETGTADGFVASQEMAEALSNVQGGLVEEPVAASPGPATREAVPLDPSTLAIEVPDLASEGVTLSVGEFSLGISLPNADSAEMGESLANGIMTYPSEGASANAVVPVGTGVQLLSVIDGEEASETYAYDLTVPEGHRLEATADGGARIVDQQERVKVEFEPAWAQDANGKNVPTRYAVAGNTLTQIVEHRNLDGVAYPVVADPLPIIIIVVTTLAVVAVAALAIGVATYIVLSWWHTCRAMNKYPELSTRNGFTARCVR